MASVAECGLGLNASPNVDSLVDLPLRIQRGFVY